MARKSLAAAAAALWCVAAALATGGAAGTTDATASDANQAVAHGAAPGNASAQVASSTIATRTASEIEAATYLLERQVVALTNAERVRRGLMPLHVNGALSEAAEWMAAAMELHRFFAHTDHLGHSIDTRIPSFGYTEYQSLGENIAAGQTSPTAVVAGWMNSPGHRANILDSGYREIGVGLFRAKTSQYRFYWAQDFGTRNASYPLVINLEEGFTKSRVVTLSIYGSDWATRMRLSNDAEHWSAWERFKSIRAWTLEPGRGMRTVYCETSDEEETRRTRDAVLLLEATEAGTRPETVRPR